MAGSRGQRFGLVGSLLAALLTLTACALGSGAPSRSGGGVLVVDPAADTAGPALVDTAGAPLRPEHAAVVASVHGALSTGNMPALAGLYAGDDWPAQAALLADPAVRRAVLDALAARPDNLGEGYVYPGAGTAVGEGWQTAFFLDYDSPRIDAGPLRWRGIAPPGAGSQG